MGMISRTIMAIEGGRFSMGQGVKCPVAFLVTEGIRPAKLFFMEVEVDGLDATGTALEAIGASGMRIDAIMAGSIPIAGFNVIDPQEIYRKIAIPSVFVLQDRPDEGAVRHALVKHFDDWEARLRVIDGAGPLHEFKTPGGEGERVLIRCVGMGAEEAFRLVKSVTVFGRVPEPVRIAKMAAKAMSDALYAP